MMHEEPSHMNIDIPIPRIYKLKSITRTGACAIKKTKTKCCSKQSIDRFRLINEDFLSVSQLKKSYLLLPFKLYSKIQDKRRFKQKMSMGIFDQYMVVVNNLKNRIHTSSPKSDISAITDVDAEFFRYVNGTPLNLPKHSYKSYKLLLTKLLRIRHSLGYSNDCILSIQVNDKNEQIKLDMSVKNFTDQISNLDIFINEDYKKSMKLLEQLEKLKIVVDLKLTELQDLGIEKFTTMSKLISLDSIYSIQQKYGRFLYYLSPPSWRMANRDFSRSIEIEQKGFDLGTRNDEDTFDELFDKLREICFSATVKPVLYFTKPSDLINIFYSMEQQQLYYFTHVNYLSPYLTDLKNKTHLLKKIIISDTSLILRSIKSLKDLLELDEYRSRYLKKKFFRILNGFFFEKTAAIDVLKLNFNLQFYFEKVFGETATHMDMIAVAKSLENLYMDLSKALDNIQSNQVRRYIEKYSEKERLKFKRAKIATTELRLFRRLEKKILRSYNFSVNTTDNSEPNKIKNNLNKKQSHKTQPRKSSLKEIKTTSLAEGEVEYLTLFTDWTPDEDPAEYLFSLRRDESKEKPENSVQNK